MAKREDKIIEQESIKETDVTTPDKLQQGGAQYLDNVRQFKLKGFFNIPQYPRAFAEALNTSMAGSMYYDTTNNVVRVKLNATWKTVTTA